jgi:hypothetical protein
MAHGLFIRTLKPPYNALTRQRKDRILEIRKDDIFTTATAHFVNFDEHYGIKLSYSTLYTMLKMRALFHQRKGAPINFTAEGKGRQVGLCQLMAPLRPV